MNRFSKPNYSCNYKNSETEAYQLTKEFVGYVGAIKLGLNSFDIAQME